MADYAERIKELESELSYLKSEFEKAKERERDLEDTRMAMLYMIQDMNESTTLIERAKRELETILDAIADPIFIHDKEFKIARVNRAYREAAGMPYKDILGKPYYEVFPRLNGPLEICIKSQELQGQHEEEVPFPYLDKVFKVRYFTIKNSDGSYLYSTHIMEDITEKKRAAERIREEAEINKALLNIAATIGTIFDRDEMLRKVVEIVPGVVEADRCAIFLWDKDQNAFLPAQVWGMQADLMPDFLRLKFSPGISIVDSILKGETVIIGDIMDSPLFPKEIAQIFGMRSIIDVPIVRRGDVIGVIGVDRIENRRPFGKREEQFLKGVTHHVATALDNIRLYRETVDKTIELSQRVETLKIIHEIDKSMLSTLESQEILETMGHLVGRLIPSDMVTVALLDKEMGGVVYKIGSGAELPKGTCIPFADTSTTEVARTGRPQFVSDLTLEKELLPLERKFFEDGYRSHIRIPLIVKGDVTGVLDVGSKRVGVFTPDHLSILEGLGAQIAVALENARLVTDLKEILLGIVRTLSAAIDAKSTWTSGHSERVTKYSIAIAREMDMDEKSLKALELAGLLHDIGKIGTYDIILDKPGKLTEEEINIIKQHPAKGAEILSPIKQLKDIIPAINYHHEFYNGTGYPAGLKGDAIPMMARILAVADTVDAMGSDRPYRKGRSIDAIIEELKRCSGSQFDPHVVEAFLRAGL